MAAEPLCEDLRGLVHDCLAKHLYESAAFYADKLVTLSDGTPSDVYVLAQVRGSATTCLMRSYSDGSSHILLGCLQLQQQTTKVHSGLPPC